nr:engulfment and cell motility protein 1-like [Oncorhynchus nerka]
MLWVVLIYTVHTQSRCISVCFTRFVGLYADLFFSLSLSLAFSLAFSRSRFLSRSLSLSIDKFWYCRLSPNHKVLHYGDLEESPLGEVSHDLLQEKLPVADIKAVVTGKDCPHMKEKGALKQNKEVLELAFSVLYESDEYLNFIAPDKHEYCVWTDGLNALLGKEMTSDFTKSDMDTLLSMEMKLRLLDLENIQIPEAPPPIPKEPSNYDFVYDCN